MLRVVDAYPMVIVKVFVDAVAPFASVTVTESAELPIAVGVPEMVPVEVLNRSPLTNVPVSAYVKLLRPPDPGTASENALCAVPASPVTGVAIDSALAIVSVAALDVVEIEIPARVLMTSTV